MNLPNKLTMLRILLIPVFVVLFYLPIDNVNYYAVVVFAIASFTDFLDGNIARKYNLVTTFGKFMDPLADKLLVLAALLMACEKGLIPAFVPIIIFSREFMVTGIRTLAASEGKVIAASPLGKAKTISQMVLIIVLLVIYPENHQLFVEFTFSSLIVDALISIATILTVVSGYDYFMKNKHIILSSK